MDNVIDNAAEKPAEKKETRPANYKIWLRKSKLQWIKDQGEKGLTRLELAQAMGIHVSTLWGWMAEHPEIREAVRSGQVVADEKVINEIHRNATGYFYDEEVPIKVKRTGYRNGKKWEKEEVVVTTVRRWHPADVLAQIFWVKNRRPEEWRDKQIIEQNIQQLPAVVIEDDSARVIDVVPEPNRQ